MTMTLAEADWVAEHVLTAKMLKSYGPQRTCACYGGTCQHCREDRHRSCVQAAWGGAPRAKCEGWITDRRARVLPGCPDVWRSGRPCRWICACGCDPYAPELPPTGGPAVAMQLDIFGELLAGAS